MAAKTDLLEAYGITLVYGLFSRADQDLPNWGSGRYVHKRFPDGIEVDDRSYQALADEAAEHIQSGKGGVLTHCYGGRNRSGLLSALILMRLTGCTGAEAVRTVQRNRKGSLVNEHFVRYLEGLT